MFTDELSPILQELLRHPVSFMGGLASGLLRLDLADDPVKGWIEKQTGATPVSTSSIGNANGKKSGPQSIEID